MKVLTTIDLLALPNLETPPTGHVGFGAKSDGLYQKIGTVESKLSVDGHTHTFASLTSKPTTLSGYGITDAASLTHTHAGVYEPVFTKNTGFNKAFGTTAGTVSEGNHTHTYLPLAGGTMSNTNLVTNLNADLLDGKHGVSYRGKLGVSYFGDYIYQVIALINLDNTDISLQSWAYGEINLNRTNGNSAGAVFFYYLQKRYNTSNMWASFSGSGSSVDLCTFTYNGVKYGGLRVWPGAAQYYGGVQIFQNYYGFEPFSIGYYDSRGTVLNSEINDSIVINGSDIINLPYRFTGTVTAPTFIGALSGNASTATKLSSNRTYALTGDVAGSVSNDLTDGFSIATTLANSGVTAGTYRSVTVDAKGRVTAGTNPTTVAGYGITDAVTLNTAQTITGAKTFSTLLTASAGVNTPKVDFGNGFTIEPSGTELVFKYNGVIKQRMLSDGSIVAIGELTAYVAAT